jgi:hypothetical protein
MEPETLLAGDHLKPGACVLMKHVEDSSYRTKSGIILEVQGENLKILWEDCVVSTCAWRRLSIAWRIEE